MGTRWRSLLAASLSGLLLASAARCIRTEWDYSAALGYGGRASEDRPGRLVAFELAAGRDPLEPLYSLRAAQVHLRRMVKSDDRAARDLHGARAIVLLQQARAALPHDPRIRAETARALQLMGRRAEALAESAIAAELGPRNPSVLALCLRLRVAAWTRTREITQLREALRLSAAVVAVGEVQARGGLRNSLGSPEVTSLGDYLEATAGRPELADEAAAILRPLRPDDAAILDSMGVLANEGFR